MTRPPEDFLSRWSRRKRQAAKEASLPANEPETAAPQDEVAAARPDVPPKADAVPQEPVFDLSKLPSLDSIGPDTDVSIFMQPGVPPSLTHAALRRAWSADPSIRDFIGLSENSWDFTSPDAMNGFGPLLPVDDVKTLLARVLKDETPGASSAEATALQQASTDTEESRQAGQVPEMDGGSVQLERDLASHPESLVHCTRDDSAPRQTEQTKVPAAAGSKRRHGGALPG